MPDQPSPPFAAADGNSRWTWGRSLGFEQGAFDLRPIDALEPNEIPRPSAASVG